MDLESVECHCPGFGVLKAALVCIRMENNFLARCDIVRELQGHVLKEHQRD